MPDTLFKFSKKVQKDRERGKELKRRKGGKDREKRRRNDTKDEWGREERKQGAVLRIKQGKILKMYQTMFSQKQTYKTKAILITIPGRADIFF